jgi:hypothetical protein
MKLCRLVQCPSGAYQRAALCVTEKLARLCPLWVITGKSRSEQLFSGLPPEADLTADIVDVSQEPTTSSSLAVHLITSSARASSLSGTIKPKTLAV